MRHLFMFLLSFGFLVSLSGCTTANLQEGQVVEDPLEDINRATFAFNDALDQVVAEPLARGYRAVTPELARDGLRNFLRNLRSPINLGNQILQGDVEGAAADLSRFTINTAFGLGGILDVAETAGLEYEREDFGQTLAVWGVDHGPYLVLPLMGPSSFRDSVGTLVDTYADPLRMYLFNIDQEEWYYARVGASALERRESLLDILDELRESSIDYYAAVRSSYIQRRAALVRDEDPEAAQAPEIPDYDDFND